MNRRRLSVSSWSLHQTLGGMRVTEPGDSPNGFPTTHKSALPLLELPRQVAHHGIETLELCHFHLPSTESEYLAQLREQLELNRIELWSLLIDGGNLNGPQTKRDFEWICRWIEVAAELGARNTRVIAGQGPPTNENLCASIKQLGRLADFASERGVRLMTENWFSTMGTPASVRRVLDELNGKVDLCLDFGNWSGMGKYSDFVSIAKYATSCHARADFGMSGLLDEGDFRRCLTLMAASDFHGPFTLIPSGRFDDEWVAINQSARVARAFCE